MTELITVEKAVVAELTFDSGLVDRWLKFAAVSKKSMQTYSACLKQLFNYFAANNISAPRREDIENFRDSLIDSGKSASTVCLYMVSCKLFFRFLAQEGIYSNVSDHVKNRVKISTAHKRDAISVDDANKLLESVAGNKLKDLRDKAIVALLLSAGLRGKEFETIVLGDIRRIQGRFFLYVKGKGRSDKSECVEIAPKVKKLIDRYLKTREKAEGKRISQNAPLFVSTSRRNAGAPVTADIIRRMIKKHLRQIGIDSPRVSCHSLRHFAACTMVEQKVALPDIQMALRHRSLNTTLIYLNYFNRINNRAELAVAQVLRI